MTTPTKRRGRPRTRPDKPANTKLRTLRKMQYHYIMDCIDTDGYDHANALTTDKEKLQFVVDTFNAEVGKWLTPREGQQKAFQHWIQGLCSALRVDFEDYRIIEIGIEWGLVKHDATERTQDHFVDSWWSSHIYMALRSACKKNDVQF